MSNVTAVNNSVATVGTGAYVTQILETIKQDFLVVNEGMDFDYVNIGTWMTISGKGNFVEKDRDGNVLEDYGDKLDVVVGKGEKRWSLWGEKKSPEDGILIVSEQDKAVAEEKLATYLQENPEAQTRYDLNSLELRYIAYVVPIISISNTDFPKIYLMSFPKTTTIDWGKYAQAIYMGKHKNDGIPSRTGVNKVITRMITSEKGTGNETWNGIDFSAVGLFNPAEYGLSEKPVDPASVASAAAQDDVF